MKSGAPGFPGLEGSWTNSSLSGLSADSGAPGEAGDSGLSKSFVGLAGESGFFFESSNDYRILARKTSNSSSFLMASILSPSLSSILLRTSSGFKSVSTSKGSSALSTREPTSMPASLAAVRSEIRSSLTVSLATSATTCCLAMLATSSSWARLTALISSVLSS